LKDVRRLLQRYGDSRIVSAIVRSCRHVLAVDLQDSYKIFAPYSVRSRRLHRLDAPAKSSRAGRDRSSRAASRRSPRSPGTTLGVPGIESLSFVPAIRLRVAAAQMAKRVIGEPAILHAPMDERLDRHDVVIDGCDALALGLAPQQFGDPVAVEVRLPLLDLAGDLMALGLPGQKGTRHAPLGAGFPRPGEQLRDDVGGDPLPLGQRFGRRASRCVPWR
jgi:hypothetical protein